MTGLAGMTEHDSASRRMMLAVPVVLVHALVIFGPLGWIFYQNWKNPRQSVFKVKLAGPLSTGPAVGAPERTRPVPNPSPKPVAPEPAVSVPKPKPAPKPAPKPVPKPKPKPAPKPAPKPVQPTRPRTVEEAQQGVYRPPAGTNTNSAVPIGSRDRAQAYGKANNAAPGGGADGDPEYGQRVGKYLESRWSEPPRSLLGDRYPEVLIEIAIASDGGVTSARILRPSGVKAMDDSVASMLAALDRVPRPRGGAVSLQILMRTTGD